MAPSAHPIKTVIIDDNPATLYSTGRILESASYQVVRCSRGDEGLAAIDESTDVAILDINLPDIDGIEICRRLRSHITTRQMGIIHLTASKVGDSDRVQGLDAGADAYLTHPVHPQVLLATVRTLLRTRAAEQAMRGSETRFRNIFDHAACGIAVFDQALRFIDANPQMLSLMNRTTDQLYGHALSEFATDSTRAQPQDIVRGLQAEGRWLGIVPVAGPGGSIVELEVNLTTRPGSEEVLGIVTDVTARARLDAEREHLLGIEREARAEAERTARIKDEFLATLSHELRNPLAPLTNALYLLQRSEPASKAAGRARDIMARQVENMARLVDDLIDVSRITRGLVQLDLVRVPLRSVIDAAVETSLPKVQAAEHQLVKNLSGVDVDVIVDPLRLAQVLTNILNNAAKYTPRGGRIELVAEVFAEKIVISVSDNGVGIPQHMLDGIFDMFRQINPTGPKAAGGLGIGLTLVRRLVEMHGGEVGVFSEGSGKGSRFVVELPRVDLASFEPATEKQHDDSSRSSQTAHAIVIDDNHDAATSLSELLRALGHRCEAFFDGESGIHAVQELLPDMVFIDIGMPDVDGIDVARRLKATPSTSHIPLFALTGWDQAHDRQRSMAAGFDRHFTKPITLADLNSVLDRNEATR